MGAAGRQFGAQARSLPTRTAQLPLMRLCVHATTIPTSEPRPRGQVETPERDRARTAGRERISKGQATRRWGTRRISKGQATSRGGRGGSRRDTQQAAGDAADLEGTGRGGEQQGQSFGGPSASARKTEARPRQRAHRAGAWGWRGEPAPWQERRN
uniref:Uncharacterized protein n=1 Tax=Populus davidiana TaxID=266767 RepID=A0A6M2F9X0_9ROSI